MTAVIVSAAAAALIILILAVPVRAGFYVSYNNSDISKELYVKILGIRLKRLPQRGRKKRRSAEDGADGGGEPELSGAEDVIRFIRDNLSEVKELIYAVLDRMFRRMIKIHLLSLRTVLGVSDAMETALLYGAEAAFVYNAVGAMDRHMRLKEHRIELKPDFDNSTVFVEFETIISANIYQLAVLGIIVLRKGVPLYKKLKNKDDKDAQQAA